MTLVNEQDEFDVEREGISFSACAAIVLTIAIFVLVVVVTSVNLTSIEFEKARVDAIDFSGYPLLDKTQADAEAKLTGYRVIDAESGVYSLPIDEAMGLVVSEAENVASVNSATSGNN